MLFAFTATVIVASAYHEVWRDEVAPLSIVRAATSVTEVAAPLKFEGHPILWYMVLYEAYGLIGKNWVLKAASLASAIGAMALLWVYCPLPWWLRGLFTFSVFPLYQYSVVSRGYGLEMLLLFAFCALHRRRREHPVALALVLAGLANSEFLGFVIAAAAVASLLFEHCVWGTGWRALRDPWTASAVAIYAAGLALAVAVAFPDATHSGSAVRQVDMRQIATTAVSALAYPAGHARGLSSIMPVLSLWLWAYFIYLLRRPTVLCFAAGALIGIEASFTLVHPAAPWHVGNVLLVVIAAMWLDAAGTSPVWAPAAQRARAHRWLGMLLGGGVTLLLAEHVLMGMLLVANDLGHDFSSSQRLGELLTGDPTLARAVVIGEPDARIVSLPYYVTNRIYVPREGLFRSWVQYTRERRSDYDLAALLAAARDVRTQCSCPVVIVLSWEVERPATHRSFGGGGTPQAETFTITAQARDEFLAATQRLATLRAEESFPFLAHAPLRVNTDERYDVYVLR